MYPDAKPLFTHSNMAEQKKKLLASLVLVVENLRNPDALSDSLRGLGARHVKYGALPEHYPLVGNSLLATFEQYLQDKWTPDVKQAWVGAYGAITEIMLDGADYTQEEVALEPKVDISLNDQEVAAINSTPPNAMSDSASGEDPEGKSNTGLFAALGGGIIGVILLLILL